MCLCGFLLLYVEEHKPINRIGFSLDMDEWKAAKPYNIVCFQLKEFKHTERTVRQFCHMYSASLSL